jgi:tRNA(Ile)-lysidine synthase
MALLHLAQHWGGSDLQIATVDHGLRPDAAAEAAMVARAASDLGLPHVTLHWQGWDGRGNLQDQARQARQDLLCDWARRVGLDAVVLGHTRDDQAETLLMRLARGSGVDGLAGMGARREAHGILWLRPLLSFGRDELRDWLRARGVGWIDDPSNDDPRFDRVKIRQAMTALGLSPARLAETATRMAEARDVLDQSAQDAARAIGRSAHGDIIFDRAGFDQLPTDTRLRLLADALRQIASSPYRPRLSALQTALTAPRATLHGCLITRSAKELRITREAQAVRGVTARIGADWDRRWTISPPAGQINRDRLEIRALGPEGLAQCPDRVFWHLPRASLLASPAIWDGARLIAAPLAGFAPEWQANPRPFTGVLAELSNSH